MRKENRKYIIRKATRDDFSNIPQYYHWPLLIEYKGKKQVLTSGYHDAIHVFRYSNDMAVLSTNARHGYASLKIIDFKQLDDYGENQVFISNLDKLDLTRPFLNYSVSAQADILAQYLP